ncbi:MAG: hypothetical protein IJ145_08895, partial [Prevotella sp.]|nr:hypothetical protein [Prevotella sp.]
PPIRHCSRLFSHCSLPPIRHCPLLFATVHVSSATVHVSFADVPHQPPSKKNHFILPLNSFSLSLLQFTTQTWIEMANA